MSYQPTTIEVVQHGCVQSGDMCECNMMVCYIGPVYLETSVRSTVTLYSVDRHVSLVRANKQTHFGPSHYPPELYIHTTISNQATCVLTTRCMFEHTPAAHVGSWVWPHPDTHMLVGPHPTHTRD